MELEHGGVSAARGTSTIRSCLGDAGLYTGSAVFACFMALHASIPLQRAWGRAAVWTYAASALVALAIASRSRSFRARTWLAIVVLVGTALIPLLLGVSARLGPRGEAFAQSEVLIVEEGATALLGGGNPYATEYLDGPLASRPRATQTHVPYTPATLVFGLPKAIAGPGPLTDARIWFLGVSLAVGVSAIRAMRTTQEGKLRTFQALFVLPTGAALVATGGHDIPVLATLLATFVLADRRRVGLAGIASGMALAMRQTSIFAIIFLACALDARERRRFLSYGALPILSMVVPLLLWDVPAFLEDIVLFPLGLGDGRSSAASPTVGTLLIRAALPGWEVPVKIGLIAAISSTVVLLLVEPPRSFARASARTGWAFSIAIALAPAARIGYLVYPISFLIWGNVLRKNPTQRSTAPPPELDLGAFPSGAESKPSSVLPTRQLAERPS